MRGTGTTTQQMLVAKQGALFIWVGGSLHYPRDLARRIGRTDLQIENPDYLDSDRWAGRNFSEAIIDHAASLTRRQFDAWQHLIARVR